MDHEEFLTEDFLTMVSQVAHTDREGAERASEAVLTVLGRHLTRGEAADVLRRLPPELQPFAWSPGSPQRFGPEEFLHRVAEREGIDPLTAERHARAVFIALRRALGADEYDDVRAQLGNHYAALLDAEAVPSVEAVVGAVAAEAGIDQSAARSLVEAVFETLAERIAPGDSEHPRRVHRAATDRRRQVLRHHRAATGRVPPAARRRPDRLTSVPAGARQPGWVSPSPSGPLANTGSVRTTSGGRPIPSALAGFTASHISSDGQFAASCAIGMRTALAGSAPAARSASSEVKTGM